MIKKRHHDAAARLAEVTRGKRSYKVKVENADLLTLAGALTDEPWPTGCSSYDIKNALALMIQSRRPWDSTAKPMRPVTRSNLVSALTVFDQIEHPEEITA